MTMGKGKEVFIASGISEGEKIRLARLAKWYRQIDVASLAGVTVEDVTGVEKDRWIHEDKKERILRVLGLLEDVDIEDVNK